MTATPGPGGSLLKTLLLTDLVGSTRHGSVQLREALPWLER